MRVEKGLLYTKDHDWVKVEGNVVTVGLADYAQDHLGDIVYVELPEVDDEVEAGDSLASVESVKAASDINAPVSGKVIEVNELLDDEPGEINKDCYADSTKAKEELGWEAKYGIREMCEDSWRWQLNNPNGYED